MEKKIGIALMTAGAFISYNVGAGFASGNELLQFFGLWDARGIVLSVLSGVLSMTWICGILLFLGRLSPAKAATENYTWIAGPAAGAFFRIITGLCVFMNLMLMYSGAGNVLTQQFGIPKIVGELLLAAASLLVVLGGMKRIQRVLGCMGVIILSYIAIFFLLTLFGGKSDSANLSLIPQAVADGKALRINLFANFPFSLAPSLASRNSPVLNGILYSTEVLMAGFPFFAALGRRGASPRESARQGILAGVCYYVCVTFMVVMLAFNFDAVIDQKTGEMFAFPALAVVDKLFHSISFTYSFLIFIGIFSATTGYLWVLSDQMFPNRQHSKENKLFILGLTLVGLLLGNRIPFSVIINTLFPISGTLGIILALVCTGRFFWVLAHHIGRPDTGMV